MSTEELRPFEERIARAKAEYVSETGKMSVEAIGILMDRAQSMETMNASTLIKFIMTFEKSLREANRAEELGRDQRVRQLIERTRQFDQSLTEFDAVRES